MKRPEIRAESRRRRNANEQTSDCAEPSGKEGDMETMYTVPISLMPYVLVLEAVLVFCIALLAFFALQDSDADHWLIRTYQRKRLAGTRLMKMLQIRNVDPSNYLRQTPVAELKRQIAVCRDCPRPATCDWVLASRLTTDFSFCPNRRAIDQAVAGGAQMAPAD